jgi:hypothetical protein
MSGFRAFMREVIVALKSLRQFFRDGYFCPHKSCVPPCDNMETCAWLLQLQKTFCTTLFQ